MNTLIPEAVNRLIAELTGREDDYYSSLSACATFRATITGGTMRTIYQMRLAEITITTENRAGEWFLIDATAMQHCLAYIRTVAPEREKEVHSRQPS